MKKKKARIKLGKDVQIIQISALEVDMSRKDILEYLESRIELEHPASKNKKK